MHSAGALRDAWNVGVGADPGAVCRRLRRDSDVESRRGDLWGHAGTRLHEDGDGGAFCADRPGHAFARTAATVERSGNREAVDGADQIFWGKDCGGDAIAEGSAEGQLKEPAVGRWSSTSIVGRLHNSPVAKIP